MPAAAPSLSYTLPAQMTAETADSLTQALLQLPLGQNPFLTLDASQVENFSTSGAQILVSLEKTIKAAEGGLTIAGRKDFFTLALEEMGLGWLMNSLD